MKLNSKFLLIWGNSFQEVKKRYNLTVPSEANFLPQIPLIFLVEVTLGCNLMIKYNRQGQTSQLSDVRLGR